MSELSDEEKRIYDEALVKVLTLNVHELSIVRRVVIDYPEIIGTENSFMLSSAVFDFLKAIKKVSADLARRDKNV